MAITAPPTGSAEQGWQVIVYYDGNQHRMDVTFSKNNFAVTTVYSEELTQSNLDKLKIVLDEVLNKAAEKVNT